MLHHNVNADHDGSKPCGFSNAFTRDISKAISHLWYYNSIDHIESIITDYT